jgi:hypothetical protein
LNPPQLFFAFAGLGVTPCFVSVRELNSFGISHSSLHLDKITIRCFPRDVAAGVTLINKMPRFAPCMPSDRWWSNLFSDKSYSWAQYGLSCLRSASW